MVFNDALYTALIDTQFLINEENSNYTKEILN